MRANKKNVQSRPQSFAILGLIFFLFLLATDAVPLGADRRHWSSQWNCLTVKWEESCWKLQENLGWKPTSIRNISGHVHSDYCGRSTSYCHFLFFCFCQQNLIIHVFWATSTLLSKGCGKGQQPQGRPGSSLLLTASLSDVSTVFIHYSSVERCKHSTPASWTSPPPRDSTLGPRLRQLCL